MKHPPSELGSVASVFNGKTPSKIQQRRSGHPVLKIRDIDEYGHFRNKYDSFVDSTFATSFPDKLVRAGDILLLNAAHNADYVASKSFFVKGSAVGSLATGEWMIIRANPKYLDPTFLSFWLQTTEIVLKLRSTVRGIHLYPTDVAELLLPLPPLDHQKWIASNLEKVDHLRRMRRYALQINDELLPANFLKTFGGLQSNPNNYPRALVEQLGQVETGSTPPRERKEYYGDNVEWIKSDNITMGDIYPAKAIEGLSAAGQQVGTLVDPGSLLVTCIAGSITSIGNVALTDRRVAFNQQINAIIPNSDVDPLFLYALMRVAKPLVQRGATEAMKKMITKSKLEELVLFKPPFVEQRSFADFLTQWSRIRMISRESLRQTDHLFQTLLHQAFTA